jgi:hypothetical protein
MPIFVLMNINNTVKNMEGVAILLQTKRVGTKQHELRGDTVVDPLGSGQSTAKV